MSRISTTFERLQTEGRRGLIPFITFGDPDPGATYDLIIALASAGASIIELGVPFSDPMADGPVIQRASERALKRSPALGEILEVAAEARRKCDLPLVLFSYLNPLFSFGLDRLSREAARAGIDGVLITDLSPEESGEFHAQLRTAGLDMIFLVAPTSTDLRLGMVAARASGFIYAVSRPGVTGAQGEVSLEAEKLVKRVRALSPLPVAVGFGISSREQVEEVWRYADAAVVGSAIVAEIERLAGAPDMVREVGDFVRGLLPPNSRDGETG